MFRVSNGIITTLNFLTLLLSLCAIFFSVWLFVKEGTPCEGFIRKPLMIVGLSLMSVSLAGMMGACCALSFFMWLYLIILFVVIVAMVAFTIFAMIVTNKDIDNFFSGKSIGDMKLDDYSDWLRNFVKKPDNWDQIKNCLVQWDLCGKNIEAGKDEEYYNSKLPPIQEGCCKPPRICGMKFENGTVWHTPPMGPMSPHGDCKAWSNNQTVLCFDCEACKAGSLYNVQKEWQKLSFINAGILFTICIIYSIGCCALRNNQYEYVRHRNYYY